MMAQPEYTLAVAIHRVLLAYGLMHTKIVNEQPDAQRAALEQRMGKLRGMPDFLVFASPNMAIEAKASRGRTSDAQKAVLADLRDRGWVVAIIKSVAELVELLDSTYGRPT
jgi:hypothetical protein